MKKTSLFTALLILSTSGLLASTIEKECSISIKGYRQMFEHSSELESIVNSSFAKKGLNLVSESELREGDFEISDLAERFDYKGLPIHEYIFSKKTSLRIVPCMALPLCSPLAKEETVTSIDGIKYNDDYSVKRVTSSGSKTILNKKFKSAYRGEVSTDPKRAEYLDSAQHKHLVLSLAKAIPSCKELRKSN